LLLFNFSVAEASCTSNTSGYYNVKTDFGAAGNGTTDDTQAIKDGVDCIRNRSGYGGGTLFFPEGAYRVVDTVVNNVHALPINLPSNIVITGASKNSRIQLDSDNASIFKIGGGVDRVAFRDILLRTTALQMSPSRVFRAGSKAIFAEGPSSLTNSSTKNINFTNMDFAGFERAIDVQATDTNKEWQFDLVKLDHVSFYESDNNIYVNTANTGWDINSCSFGVAKTSYSVLSTGIVIEKGAAFTIKNSQGSGPPVDRITNPTAVADTFIWVKGPFTLLSLISSASENFYNALVVDFASYEATVQSINSSWGDYVLIRADSVYVSMGTHYHANTVQVIPPSDARRFAYDANTHPNGARGTHGYTNGAYNALLYSMGDRFDYTTAGLKSCPPTMTYATADSADCKRDFYLNNTPGGNALVFRSGQTGSAGGDSAINDFHRPLRLGNAGCDTCYYQIERDGSSTDGTVGYLSFSGQQSGYIGFKFNGPVLPQTNNTGSLGSSTHKWGSVYTTNLYQGDSILVDKETGTPLYKIYEDKNFIYFDNILTGKNLMRLDKDGNLLIAGRIIQNASSVTSADSVRTKRRGVVGKKTKAKRRSVSRRK
jgi:hypothetical protein